MEFELGQLVIVKAMAHAPAGKVIGIWEQLFGKRQYHVRCVDSTGRPFENWWFAEDLSAK
jgi:hypothetical protein